MRSSAAGALHEAPRRVAMRAAAVAALFLVTLVVADAAPLREELVFPSARYSMSVKVFGSSVPMKVPPSADRSVFAGVDAASVMSAYIPFRIRFMTASTVVLRAELSIPYRYFGPPPAGGRYRLRMVGLPVPFRLADMVSPPDFPGTTPVDLEIPPTGPSGVLTVDVTSFSAAIRPAEWAWLRIEPISAPAGSRLEFAVTPSSRPELRVLAF